MDITYFSQGPPPTKTTAREEGGNPSLERGPPPTTTTAKEEGGNPSLQKTISAARIALAKKENAYIDLTQSDSDEEVKPTTWSDPEDIAQTTQLLANIAPAIFAERSGELVYCLTPICMPSFVLQHLQLHHLHTLPPPNHHPSLT